MNIAQTIRRDLDNSVITECNHPTRRYFRCWIDGSYLGCEHYQDNLDRIRQADNTAEPKRSRMLRSFVIEQFTQYTAHESECSYGYAQKVITGSYTPEQLDRLNTELIEDALDLIAD